MRARALDPWATRLRPRCFIISLVNSFVGNFVWQRRLCSSTKFKLNRAPPLDEWRQLLTAYIQGALAI